jgi:hypothetical protein
VDLQLGLLVVLLVAVIGWYLSYSASRLDRLHHRVEGTRSALDAQLVRRAEAAVELATSGALDPASGLLVAGAAAEALAVGDSGTGREQAESDLSHALQATLSADVVQELSADAMGGLLLRGLVEACHRVQLARRFHNDAVTTAIRVRGKRISRWARLAGRAPLPRTFEMDDDLPEPLQD